MDILALQYFLAVAKYRNFTKAARLTYTSQPNISKRISQLEEEIGVQLFIRSNTGAELTPAGAFFERGVAQILPDLEHLLEETQKIGENEPEARIRLGLCESMDLEQIAPGFFSRLIQAMTPDIQIQIETHSIELLLEKLAVEELDCIFYFSPLRADIPDVRRMAINRSTPYIYFSANHPLAQKENLCVTDFSTEVFVESTSDLEFEDPYNVLPFTPPKRFKANSVNAAFLYIESGEAVGLFGPSQNRLGKEGIRTIKVPTDKCVGTDAVWLAGKENATLKRFLEFLQELAVSE